MHELLKDYLPKNEDDPEEFIIKMLQNASSNTPALLEAYKILTDLDDEEIKDLPPEEQYLFLVKGFTENKIVSMMEFVESFDA